MNVYRYVKNGPTLYVDPFGLFHAGVSGSGEGAAIGCGHDGTAPYGDGGLDFWFGYIGLDSLELGGRGPVIYIPYAGRLSDIEFGWRTGLEPSHRCFGNCYATRMVRAVAFAWGFIPDDSSND